MQMSVLQLYKNIYKYPHYSEELQTWGNPMDCTPVGMNLKTGSLRVKAEMSDFMGANYLSLTRDNETIYAWIDNVEYLNDTLFHITYSVDAWRTYKTYVSLGTQFIVRQPETTTQYDPLLSSPSNRMTVTSKKYGISDRTKRVFVVQVRVQTGEVFSRTPVNPSPYQFYMREYDLNNWLADESIDLLMSSITDATESTNIVTMYSIPYMDLSGLSEVPLIVDQGSSSVTVNGFKMLGDNDPTSLLTVNTPIVRDLTAIDDFMRVEHSMQIVIPEAGIIQVPDELITRTDLVLRQDIDLYSGACNYMLTTSTGDLYTQSVRGSSLSSIPIVSDPMDTYISQNQNALTTSLMGDVASMVIGGGVAVASGGAGALLGAGAVVNGINNIASRSASIHDMTNKVSSPPAFLGTALVANFNQMFWVVTSKKEVTNADYVHTNFGYPINMVKPLTFPTSGFIQTEGCNVYSMTRGIPRWAIEEINQNFNNGILVHAVGTV